MKVAAGKRIRLKVKLEVVGGEILEQNIIEYFQGGGAMLPALEAEIDGCEVGDKKSGVLPAKKAFGDPATQTRKSISKKEFPEDAEFEVGMRFEAKGADGVQNVVLQVEKIEDDSIEVLLLHPLADKDLNYEFEVMNITDPTPPPLPPDIIGSTVEEEGDS